MIQEDYVSFEIAKLLKKKGFDWGCYKVYNKEGIFGISTVIEDVPTNYKNIDYYFLCPTLQMAMKWLREEHNLLISIGIESDGYYYTTQNIKNECFYDSLNNYCFSTYEEATQAAIMYCLNNLI